MTVLEKIKNELLDSMTIEEVRETLEKKETEAMNNLEGKRVRGFLLSVRKDTSHYGKYSYHYVFADKSIDGDRCLIKLGRVYNLEQAEKALLEKLDKKITKNVEFQKFME